MKNSGLTVVELTVSMAIATAIVVGVVPLLIHILISNTHTSVESLLQVKAQNAFSTISSHMSRSQKLLTTPDISNTDPPAPSGGWQGSHTTLVLRQVATTNAVQNDSREPVFTGVGNTSDCSVQRNPVLINQVIYKHESSLYLRTIVPEIATCDSATIAQTTSCLTCTDKPKDIMLASNVESITISYIPSTNPDDGPDANTQIASVSLTMRNNNVTTTANYSFRLLAGQ